MVRLEFFGLCPKISVLPSLPMNMPKTHVFNQRHPGLFSANINANQPWHRTSQAMGDHGLFFLGRLMLVFWAGFCS